MFVLKAGLDSYLGIHLNGRGRDGQTFKLELQVTTSQAWPRTRCLAKLDMALRV
jgi:hypothetical protein